MIIGIGTDILKISRIEKLYNLFGNKFLKRIFTDNEILKTKNFSSHQRLLGYYAKRFSAKESFAKALGVGIGKEVSFLDIEILNNSLNQPFLHCNDKIVKYIKNKYDCEFNIFLSLSDESDIVSSIVIIEKIGK